MSKSSSTDDLLKSLLGPPTNQISKGPLIQDLSGDEVPISNESSEVQKPEGPSLLEMMMEEQKAAARESQSIEEKKNSVEVKKNFGSGLKKGFLQSSSTTKSESAKKSKDLTTLKKNKEVLERKSESIYKDVQSSLHSNDSPMMNQLKNGDWVTPDLMKEFQKNPILAKGFQNPRYMEILRKFQENPSQLKDMPYDADIDAFLKEFGKVMAKHFEALAGTNGSNISANTTSPSSPISTTPASTATSSSSKIREVGPLEVNARKAATSSHAPVSSKNSDNNSKGNNSDKEAEEKRVQEILANGELRELLMDPAMQKVLQECGDPRALRVHMSNPEIARKIQLMVKAGLVKFQ